MIIACICGGIIEGIVAVILAIFAACGICIRNIWKKKHGIHGDEECDCKCHHKH